MIAIILVFVVVFLVAGIIIKAKRGAWNLNNRIDSSNSVADHPVIDSRTDNSASFVNTYVDTPRESNSVPIHDVEFGGGSGGGGGATGTYGDDTGYNDSGSSDYDVNDSGSSESSSSDSVSNND